MKFFTIVIILALSSCASINKKYKMIPEYQGTTKSEKYNGKKPDEVFTMLGEPLSAGWVDKSYSGTTRYYMTYVVGEGEFSTLELMTGGQNMNCLFFFFEKSNNFKLVDEIGSRGGLFRDVCSALQKQGEYTYDDSLFKLQK